MFKSTDLFQAYLKNPKINYLIFNESHVIRVKKIPHITGQSFVLSKGCLKGIAYWQYNIKNCKFTTKTHVIFNFT